jgi:hypothetical protein
MAAEPVKSTDKMRIDGLVFEAVVDSSPYNESKQGVAS